MAAKKDKKGGESTGAKLSVRDELMKAVGTKMADGESHADLATRLCEKVTALSDNDFHKLSKEAQDWFNDAADAINAKKVPPKFPSGETASAPVAAEAPKVEEKKKEEVKTKAKEKETKAEGEETKTKETTKVATAKKAKGKTKGKNGKSAAKSTAAPKTKKEPGKESMALRVRRIVVGKPDISFEDVVKKLGEKHDVGGHAWNIFNHAKCVMELVGAK